MNTIYRTAWKKAQKLRARVEDAVAGFFQELVTVGIDVAEPPELGDFTPTWEPLSDSWIARKGHDNFFFATGALEQALLRKNTVNTFGRPQVFLEFNGNRIKVNAGEAAKKYSGESLKSLKVIVNPFPRVVNYGDAEALISSPGTKTFYKLTGHGFQRPLVSPFMQWWIHVRMKRVMKGQT